MGTTQCNERVAVGVVCLALLALVVAGCGEGESSPSEPDLWPYPTADELCGTATAWPDDVHFVTARYVVRRFREKTGHSLQRHTILEIPGARAFIEVKDPDTFDVFGQFVLSVVDPRCPELVEWLGARGEPGPGGLVWENTFGYGGSCWAGNRRFPRSNLVVNWTGDCERRVYPTWGRLDAVLTEIAERR